jgi:NAD(P)-dependent dehydrogenase (short-subunit alcohol dehydrogenase family)
MAFDIGTSRAFVTGGNSGIGRATAVALARLGAEVLIMSRDPDRLHVLVDTDSVSTDAAAARRLWEISESLLAPAEGGAR